MKENKQNRSDLEKGSGMNEKKGTNENQNKMTQWKRMTEKESE